MNMITCAENQLKWLKSTVVPRVAGELQIQEDDTRYELSVPEDALYISGVYFLKIVSRKSNTKMELVIKVPPYLKIKREYCRSDSLFHNEILFYTKFAKHFDNFPRCVYSKEEDPPEKSVIALENLKNLGFQHLEHNLEIDMEHACAAMRTLARFHGNGYLLKTRKPEEFFENVRKIQPVRFTLPEPEGETTFSNKFVNYYKMWAIIFFDRYVSKKCQKLKKIFYNIFSVCSECFLPIEPLAVLCHGDFTSNNVLFKYSNDARDISIRIFDFAWLWYCSPTIDISTFIYVSCSRDVQINKYAELLRVYHDALIEYLKNNGVSKLDDYSLEALTREYKTHAIYSFVIAYVYKTILNTGNFSKSDEYLNYTPEECCKIVFEHNNDEVFQKIVDQLMHLYDTGCLDHLI